VQYDSNTIPAIDIRQLRKDFMLPREGTIVVAGSTHEGEEKILLSIFRHLLEKRPNLFLIVAPRNPDRGEEIASMARQMGFAFSRRSEQEADNPFHNYSGLILDTIGELHGIYQAGDICFIGGSMIAAGGHNPLEPAALSKPVLFGPHMEDFKEIAAALVAAGGARTIHSETELVNQLLLLLADERQRLQQGLCAFSVVQEHQGATRRCMDIIQEMLKARTTK
jgi:3-deoxy-D-manno-octulosonic-acid transferase